MVAVVRSVLFAARLGFIFVAVAEIDTVNDERHIRTLGSARIGRSAVPVAGPVPPFERVACTFRHQQDSNDSLADMGTRVPGIHPSRPWSDWARVPDDVLGSSTLMPGSAVFSRRVGTT